MFLKLLQFIAKKEGKESPAYAQTLGYLANQSIWENNYHKSLRYSQEAVAIYERIGATTDVYYAFCLNTMGQANMQLFRFEEAEKQFLKAMLIAEKAFGKKDSRYASLLSLLSILYNRVKAYDKAIPVIMESLELTSQATGKESLPYSRELSNLATAYIELGHLEKAEPLLVEAVAIQEKFIAKGNQVIEVQIPNNLASLYRMTNRFDLAEQLCKKIDAIVESSTLKNINYMSEAELQQSINTTEVRNSAFSLAYSATLNDTRPHDMVATCFDKVLFYKGFLQQAVIRERQLAVSHPNSRADLDSLRSLQIQLTRMYALPKAQQDQMGMTTLEATANDLEKK